MNIDYKNFKKDLNSTIRIYLDEYDFFEVLQKESEFEKIYMNNYWSIKISMLSLFPHISVSFSFYSLTGEYCKPNILVDFLKIDKIELSDHFSEFSRREKDINDYKTQMMYVCECIDRFYKPLLNGQKKYSDYLKFEDQYK
ncbi:hypothetical protein [Aquimarina algiphila]|uniref:hypothetical protein n=1 Tax=Aquimarina algiphila TaxID=2047982 RepID=UPI00232D3FE0|nr:hypothetical protein [Aquimarina algiphila]